MRIALVTFAGGDRVDELVGPDAPVPALAGELARQGHDVRLYTRGRPHRAARATDVEGYPTTVLAAGPRPEMPETDTIQYVGDFVEPLSRSLRDGDFEVVHSHGWLAGLATQLAAPPDGVPTVHTFHQLQLIDELTESAAAAESSRPRTERAVALKADHLIATTETERDVLVRAGVRRDRITVVPPGVGEEPVGEPVARSGRRRLVAFGPAERAAAVIHALTALPHAELVLAGEAAEEAQAQRLGALADRLRLADRVSVRPLSADPAELIRSANVVLCLPSSAATRNEHLLAMAHGVPLIAGTRATAEAVVDGVTGLRALDATPGELAKQLRTLLGSEARWLGMSVAARDRALSRYGWERIGEETVRVYRHVVGRDETFPEPLAVDEPTGPRA